MTHDYDVLMPGVYFCDLIFTGLPSLPRLGADLFGTGFDMAPGGLFMTALAFQRLGVRAGWSCDFGDDIFSRFVLDAAGQAGLDTRLFRRHPFPVRRISVALSYPHDRGFVSFMDDVAAPPLLPLIERYRPRCLLLPHLHYDEGSIAAIAAARQHGCLVYMDCQYTDATLATPGVAAALRAADIFAPNAGEAMQLTGAASTDEALARLAELSPLPIIKCGGDGAVAWAGERAVRVPALSITTVDTTGAGDCFNAGFLHGYLSGESLESCLRRGNICGGLKATARGLAGIPTAEQVELRLRDYARGAW
jgi:sugar/nucleoside kinase (ribokinase family)